MLKEANDRYLSLLDDKSMIEENLKMHKAEIHRLMNDWDNLTVSM